MNNVSSPRNDDHGIEHEIVARGLTAPRVTPQDLEDNIIACYFFTAEEGVLAEELINKRPTTVYEDELKLLTFCVLVLRNGFTVTGESACASKKNFDAALGKRIARENAKQKLWPLMGYALKEQLQKETK